MKPPTLPASDWTTFRDAFVLPEGRVVDTANSGISHSEGQGYAMLFAVSADARADFQRVWAWTQANLQVRGDDPLLAWSWTPDRQAAADLNSATDGDILVAWALLEAAERWAVPDYQVEADAILKAIEDKAVIATSLGPALLPGPEGFSSTDGKVTLNLSYWIFPALRRFETLSDKTSWESLHRTGVKLTDAAKFGASELPSDWITFDGKRATPSDGWEPVFGYNTIRVPIYACLSARLDGTLPVSLSAYKSHFTADPDNGAALLNVVTGTPTGTFPKTVTDRIAEQLESDCAASTAPFGYVAGETNYYDAALILLMRLE